MANGPGPIRYVLYSHYGYSEGDDFRSYATEGTRVEDLAGVRYLLRHCRGLRELLSAPGHEGMLVLFLATGYEKFLNALAQGKNIDTLVAHGNNPDSAELRYVKSVAEYLRSQLKLKKLENRVRIVSCVDLGVILGRVNAILTGKFHDYFIGHSKGIRYDAPKIVEAILRLRLLGNGVPVLRLDHDVLFRNRDIGDLGLFKAIACAVRAYQLRLAKTTVSTFLFSASYNTRALEKLFTTPHLASDDLFGAWSQAFATRINPALVADPEKLNTIVENIQKKQKTFDKAKWKQYCSKQWNEYIQTHVNNDLARKFYGLELGPELRADGIKGVSEIGAHPLYAVISGALFCLSDGAILDLPPFSNMTYNVMWIDDHLKYSLHRAMNHFTSGDTLDLEPGLSDARLDVSVTKSRPGVDNIPAYTFGVYLPTVLWGSIMDAWINNDSILKARLALLSKKDQRNWKKADKRRDTAPLPRAMLKALRVGSFDPTDSDDLSHELECVAIERIEKIRRLWMDLRTRKGRSFASYWAAGKVERNFKASCFSKCEDTLWQGITVPASRPVGRLGDLSADMALAVRSLIHDGVGYVGWTLEWPRFVQIVRSIKQGEFVGDLSWHA